MGTETDGENSESEEVIVDNSSEKCMDGSEKVIIETISEVNANNDTESSKTGSGSDSNNSDTESESSGSQPNDEDIVQPFEMKDEKSECVSEFPGRIAVKTSTLRNIDSVNDDEDIEKENSSNMKLDKDCEEQSVDVANSNVNLALSRKITLKSPPLIDISNKSTGGLQ